MKAFQVNDNFDKVIDLDFSGARLSFGGRGIDGVISIETEDGWKHYCGEHGFTDYADEYGFIIDTEEEA
jgi:hypothetical protein